MSQMSAAFRAYTVDELGDDGYPPEWHATIKHAVRAHAGDRCVRCGHPYLKGAGEWSPCDERCTHGEPYRYAWNGGWEGVNADTRLDAAHALPAGVVVRQIAPRRVEAQWRILTVHHLDGDKGNCRWWNLAALCQRCHLQIQGRVQMARVWPWEHSPWFRPYVAGYYAWVYLREDLTRDQVDVRLGELLALEAIR